MKSKAVSKGAGKSKEKTPEFSAVAPKNYVPRLKLVFKEKVLPAMMKEFGYKNPMQVPRIERIVLNVGMGEAVQNVKLLESAAGELEQITGQKPVLTRAKKAIAGFKLREDIPILSLLPTSSSAGSCSRSASRASAWSQRITADAPTSVFVSATCSLHRPGRILF